MDPIHSFHPSKKTDSSEKEDKTLTSSEKFSKEILERGKQKKKVGSIEGKKIKESSTKRVKLKEIFDANQFRKAIFSAKKASKYGAAVHVYDLDEYKETRMFLMDDGLAGVAVKDNGEIVSVFKHPSSTVTQVTKFLLPRAINAGGKRLDCFSINKRLPMIYAKFGFVPVAKVKFDKSQAPKDWNLPDEPDIIFMIHKKSRELNYLKLKTSEELLLREKKVEQEVSEIIDKLEYVSYEDAIKMQNKELELDEFQS